MDLKKTKPSDNLIDKTRAGQIRFDDRTWNYKTAEYNLMYRLLEMLDPKGEWGLGEGVPLDPYEKSGISEGSLNLNDVLFKKALEANKNNILNRK